MALVSVYLTPVQAMQAEDEYEPHVVKAGLIARFLLYTSWPQHGSESLSDTPVIGIIGAENVELAFAAAMGEQIAIKALEVRHVDVDAPIDELASCQVLFISSSVSSAHSRLLRSLAGHAVLTIGDHEGFLEAGGMINILITEEGRPGFEVNIRAARQAGIGIRAGMLRLAVRVIQNGE
jgi:hypothetical protein